MSLRKTIEIIAKRTSQYPDNSVLWAEKARGRRQRAAMSFAEKLRLVDALKERVRPIVEARERRKRETHRG